MQNLLIEMTLATGCTAEAHSEGPWLEMGTWLRFEGGALRGATCEDLATDRVRIRVYAFYDTEPAAIDDEGHYDALFEVHPSIFDGLSHQIRGWVDVPSDGLRDPDAEGLVFTADEGHDPAILHAVAIPWTIWEAPYAGRFHLSGTIRLEEGACSTGSMQLLAEGDTVPFGRMEAFMPIEPQARP